MLQSHLGEGPSCLATNIGFAGRPEPNLGYAQLVAGRNLEKTVAQCKHGDQAVDFFSGSQSLPCFARRGERTTHAKRAIFERKFLNQLTCRASLGHGSHSGRNVSHASVPQLVFRFVRDSRRP